MDQKPGIHLSIMVAFQCSGLMRVILIVKFLPQPAIIIKPQAFLSLAADQMHLKWILVAACRATPVRPNQGGVPTGLAAALLFCQEGPGANVDLVTSSN